MIRGLFVVAQWELKQRVRSRKLLIGWLVWMALLVAVALLIVQIARSAFYDGLPADWGVIVGPTVFGFVVLFVLGFALVIVPTFSAAAIVSERESATLATLQATDLTAGQIVGGKLLAACAVAAGFLAGAVPALGIAVVLGHIEVWRAVGCLLVVYAEMVLLCAIAIGWSAVAARTAASVVLTYITVFVLSLGSLLAFVLVIGLTNTSETHQTWGLSNTDAGQYEEQLSAYYDAHPAPDGSQPPAPPLERCALQTDPQPITTTHTERIWWLLLINPFVMVSDAAPLPSDARGDIQAYLDNSGGDPLASIAAGVRSLRLGDATQANACFTGRQSVGRFMLTPNPNGSYTVVDIFSSNATDRRSTAVVDRPVSPVPPRRISMDTPLWPIGLAANFVIAALFYWIAWRRVKVPYGPLPKGQRVA